MRWVNLPVAQLAKRYDAGESTYVLGRACGVGHMTIWRRLRAAGVKMRPRAQPGNKNALGNKSRLGQYKRGGPLYIRVKSYLSTNDRDGRQCYIHRGCWEAHNGPIPWGYVIHHINGNSLDNAISNLACLSDTEHKHLHGLAQRGL